MPTTTSPTGAARAAVFAMFLCLTDPVVPFDPEDDDPGATRDAFPGRPDHEHPSGRRRVPSPPAV